MKINNTKTISRILKCSVSIICGAFIYGCESNSSSSPETSVEVDAPIAYQVSPPDGYLPFPQHDPDFSDSEYLQMLQNLYIISNFGTYQGDGNREGMYLHDALDIVLPNGTELFFIENGTVVKINDQVDGYKSILVEDEDQTGMGWNYVHVDEFDVTLGEKVFKGQPLGVVNFNGLEHIHLTRVMKSPNRSWQSGYLSMFDDGSFYFEDTTPPDLTSQIYVFEDMTDNLISTGENPVYGKVDLVVGVRDDGDYAHSDAFPGVAARIFPKAISFALKDAQQTTLYSQSFELNQLLIDRNFQISRDALTDQAQVLLKPPLLIRPDRWSEIGFNYVILTHMPNSNEATVLDLTMESLHWDTLEQDNNGNFIYPNGEYTITVTVTDGHNNIQESSYNIQVMN